MNSTMRAVVIRGPQDYSVETVPVPPCPDDGLVLAVHACGLCGSDLRTLRQGHHRVKFPWIVGHEICGTVVQKGASCAGGWNVGDRLALGPLVFCGKCRFCLAQTYELCENYAEIAQKWHGGFAEYVAIPGDAIRNGTMEKVPDGMDPAHAAVTEPVSSCVHAQEKGHVGKGDTVVIIGAGPIGCIHVSLARAHGANKVYIVDVNQTRLDLVVPFGADLAINASQCNPVEKIRELTQGRGADVVITANPVPETQVQAVEMAGKGGRILLFGGLPPERCRPGIDTNLIHYNALSVIGTTIFAPRHFKTAFGLLGSGALPAEKLVSHRFALEDFVAGAKMALDGAVIKAVFLP